MKTIATLTFVLGSTAISAAAVTIPPCATIESFLSYDVASMVGTYRLDVLLDDTFGVVASDMEGQDIDDIARSVTDCIANAPGGRLGSYFSSSASYAGMSLRMPLGEHRRQAQVFADAELAEANALEGLGEIERTIPPLNEISADIPYRGLSSDQLAAITSLIQKQTNLDQSSGREGLARTKAYAAEIKRKADEAGERSKQLAYEAGTGLQTLSDWMKNGSPVPKESQDGTLLIFWYVMFLIAEHCAEHDASFTAAEVAMIQSTAKAAIDAANVATEQKDTLWRLAQAQFGNTKATLTYQSCAADRQQLMFTHPQIFLSQAPQRKSPF